MTVSLRVTAPICGFRKPYAREFLETERIPPPATVYGFLLSLVGEEDRATFSGSRIALAVINPPKVSRVVRSTWHVKKKKLDPGIGSNRKPDYQEILTGLEIGVWVDDGPLAERLRAAMRQPASVVRFGGLSLGESRDLVNDVTLDPAWEDEKCTWLFVDPEGENPLPVWVDHVGAAGTQWKQFKLVVGQPESPGAGDARWIEISNAPRG